MHRSMVRSGRRRAEMLMTTQVTIRRITGVTTDPLTGVDVPTAEVVYEGRGKLQGDRQYESSRAVGGAVSTEQRTQLHIPVSSPPVEAGDVVDVVASPGSEYLVGLRFRVAGPHEVTHQTSHRMYVERVI